MWAHQSYCSKTAVMVWKWYGTNPPRGCDKSDEVIGKSEQGFTKGVLYLTNLITFYSRVTCCVV